MLNIAVCDDSSEDRELLIRFINKAIIECNTDVNYEIFTFESGEDLEEYYNDGKSSFYVIFLDIYMTGMNGIETAHAIRKNDDLCKIIFTTTSTDHALEGYSVFAYNYLVKPISFDTFKPIFEKAIEDIGIEKQKSLCIKTGAKIETIMYRDIKYIESCGKTIIIHSNQGSDITTYAKLDEIEAAIDDTRFLRSHKSFLVNMLYIKSVEQYNFILKDTTIIPIRQKGFPELKRLYYEFILKMADLN